MPLNRRYDIIIIGSGMGALALASIMSKVNNKKVLILERHFKIGGYTSSFSRKDYKWDVGLHYVGRVLEGELPGKIFDFITDGKLKWHKVSEPFEKFIYPDFTFEVFGDERKYKRDLIKLFPKEGKAIKSYFKDVKSVTRWFIRYYLSRFLPAFFRIPLKVVNKFSQKKALLTTAEYLQSCFKDPKLKSLLTSQWGDYGLPPSKSAFLIHAVVVNHYLKGGYYPRRGAEEIAKNIVPIIERHGGNCLVNHEVSKLIVERDRAVGVRVNVHNGSHITTEEYYAPIIVSNAGVYNTYAKLIPKEIHIPFAEKCFKMYDTSSSVTLYVGLKDDVASLGITGANLWIYDSYDHEKNFCNNAILNGKPSSCYVSFKFQEDSHVKPKSAVIIAYVDYSAFIKWEKQSWRKRDKDYYDLKDTIIRGLINFVDRHYPGFGKMVDYTELATPLTSEHFTDHLRGNMYGLPATPERYRQNWLKVKTPIKGFYLTGSDVSSLGIVSSMMGGVATASLINGKFGLFKLMAGLREYNNKK